MTFYIIIGLSAFFISLLGSRLTILALRKRTTPRSLPDLKTAKHRLPPAKSGIALVFAILICAMMDNLGYGILLSMLMLIAVSLLSDLIAIPYGVRLVVQAMAVGLPLSMMDIGLFPAEWPRWIELITVGSAWLIFMQSFRPLDRVDGLAAAETISIGGGLCLVAALVNQFPSPMATYGLISATAACGFWWWSRHPAKIRLGEVGTVPLSFFLGYLFVLAMRDGYYAVILILPAYVIADGLATVLRRIHLGKPILLFHSDFYCLRALQNGRSPESVVRFVFGINFLLIFLAVQSVLAPDIALFHISLAYLSIFMLLGFFAHTQEKPSWPQQA